MGPEISVLLRRELAPEELEEIAPLLRCQAGIEQLACPDDTTESSVSLGVYRHALLKTDCFWVRLLTMSEEDRALAQPHIAAAIGWWPRQAIWMDAGQDDLLSHKVLGRATAALAERFDGLIDMHGSITPPVSPSRLRHPEECRHSLNEVSRFVRRFRGEVHEWYYVKEDGSIWVHHFVDAQFMRSWLEWPSFHLVK